MGHQRTSPSVALMSDSGGKAVVSGSKTNIAALTPAFGEWNVLECHKLSSKCSPLECECQAAHKIIGRLICGVLVVKEWARRSAIAASGTVASHSILTEKAQLST